MQHKRKWALALLVAMLAAVILSACSAKDDKKPGNDASPSRNDSAAANTTAEEPFDPMAKYDPPIEIEVGRVIESDLKYKEGESEENNIYARDYKEMGITFKEKWRTDTTGATEKMNVAIASGDLPDIYTVSSTQFRQLVDAGQLADLTEAFEQYASPQLKQMTEADGGIAFSAGKVDGRLYGLSFPVEIAASAPALWVRTDWLQKLNLQEPKTIEDIYTVAEAFANNDPDGNGKKDTYGLVMNKELWLNWSGLEGLFNAHHAYPHTWIKKGDELVYGSVQPEMKAVLAKLQEMYKSGIIDKEFGTKDSWGKLPEDMNNNKFGMFFGQWWAPAFPIQAAIERNPDMRWKAIPTPSVDGQPTKYQVSSSVPGTLSVANKKFEHPEAMIKLLNHFVDKNYGENADWENYHIDSTQQYPYWKYAAVKAFPADENMTISKHVRAALANQDPSQLNSSEKLEYDAILKFRSGDAKSFQSEARFGELSPWVYLEEAAANGQLQPNEFHGPATPTMAQRQSTLDKREIEIFTKIIMDASPVDEFDKFVQEWNTLGGAQISQEVNEWYNNK